VIFTGTRKVIANLLNGETTATRSFAILDIVNELALSIGAIVGCIIVRKRNKLKLSNVIQIKKTDWKLCVLLGCLAVAMPAIVDELIGVIFSNFTTIEIDDNSYMFNIPGFIMAVFVAPILEEIVCRYCVNESLRGAYPIIIICIFDGFFFCIGHGYNIQGSIDVFVFGLIMSFVYCKTHNLCYTIVAHALNNAYCFIPLEVAYEKNGFIILKWWSLLIFSALSVLGIVYYIKVFRKKYTENYFEINHETGKPIEQKIDIVVE
jgi:membrane protease YdiL (CAAX protease family)